TRAAGPERTGPRVSHVRRPFLGRFCVLLGAACLASLAAAPPDAPSADGTTALDRAVSIGDVAKAESLIRSGADVNAINRYGATPLSLAAADGNARLVVALLKAGADPRKADGALREGRTLLMLAARTGNVDAMTPLLAAANVNAAETRTGTTALMWAALENRADAVRALATAGAEVNARSTVTAYPHTPPGVIGDALEEDVSYVGQTVLPRGGWTALMYAARQGALDAARALVQAGASLNLADPDGTPALTFAIINGHYDVATLLVKSGADVNQPDRTGATPLYSAVDMHTLVTSFGRPELTRAVTDGSLDAAKMLLAHGADPNRPLKTRVLKRTYQAGDARLAEGATPLMRAAKAGDVVMMKLLVEAGADMDRTNAAGETAMHIAANVPKALRFLADEGASPDLKNARGLTPLEALLKVQNPNADAVAFLRDLTGDYTTLASPEAPAGRRRAQ
ncbi:MAG TPA: ankyrin repeat domain-containing protein, partial [Vicinamibacterales bacterium]|nr:ankyrin repeat domain-containing protein [Vicinamibacterales bacterium]